MSNLGELYRRQARYDEAEELFAAVLRIVRGKPRADGFARLEAIRQLARLYQDCGREDDAAPLLAEAMILSEQISSRNETSGTP
jgi:hypothetical protein